MTSPSRMICSRTVRAIDTLLHPGDWDLPTIAVGVATVVLILLLAYCGVSTMYADFPVEGASKWEWVWKALLWSIFLPLVLRMRGMELPEIVPFVLITFKQNSLKSVLGFCRR